MHPGFLCIQTPALLCITAHPELDTSARLMRHLILLWLGKKIDGGKKNLQSQSSISTPRVGNMVRGVRVTPSGTAKRKRIITLWKRRFACQGEMQASPQFHRNSRENWEFGEVHPGMEEVYSREPLTRRAEIWKVSPGLLLLSAQM